MNTSPSGDTMTPEQNPPKLTTASFSDVPFVLYNSFLLISRPKSFMIFMLLGETWLSIHIPSSARTPQKQQARASKVKNFFFIYII